MDKGNKYWITSANQSYYKVEDAYKSLPEIDWALSASPKVGDIVFIYLSDKQKYVRFKTEVVKTDIPYNETIPDDEFYAEEHVVDEKKIFTRLRLLSHIRENAVTRNLLLSNGMKGNIQCTRSIPSKIADMIDKYICDENLIFNNSFQEIFLNHVGKNYTCEIPISKEQWIDILNNKELTNDVSMRILLSFYFMPEHKATCFQCSQKYGYPTNFYNVGITNFGKSVVKHLGTFAIICPDNGLQCYWPVAIGVGSSTKDQGVFEWELRKELVEALENIIINNALEHYIRDFDLHWDAKDWSEIYKWRAAKWFQDNWDINAPDFTKMLDVALAKTGNLLQSQNSFPRGMIVNMAKVAPNDVRNMFSNLFDEQRDLVVRINDFIAKSDEFKVKYNDGTWYNHYQTTNSISVYLWLRYPEKYYIYKYSVYKEVDKKFGLNAGIKTGDATKMLLGYRMYDKIHEILLHDIRVRELIDSYVKGHDDLHADSDLRIATMDFGYWVNKAYISLEQSLTLENSFNMTPFIKEASELLKNKKNVILQGAPGTGKTYNTAALALALIDGFVPKSHQEIMDRYEQLRCQKQIGFVTFHQSMDYEDFVEGIKPYHENDDITYRVEDGIFKILSNLARENVTNSKKSSSEISKQASFKAVYDELIDLVDSLEIKALPIKTDGKSMQIEGISSSGNIILKTEGTDKDVTYTVSFDRIKPILDAYPDYNDFIAITNVNNAFREIIGGCNSSSIWAVLNYLYTHKPKNKGVISNKIEIQPYVLIIDEINRGNISKIFGELITLIEKDKRLGSQHPITLSLPYSKNDNFGVPENLYIIGTMNTTDRSTGTIDYAIRRRFAFITLPATRNLIEDETAKTIFDNVKNFIEKYKYADMDIEDLMIGHSYFMAADNNELSMKIKFEVIPLIKEYIKDGILSIKPFEAKKYFDSWLNLETIAEDDNNDGTSED